MTRSKATKQTKGTNSVRGWRKKKQGGQSGGAGYNERTDGKSHERADDTD